MWVSWSAERRALFERNAWSVSGVLDHAVELGLLAALLRSLECRGAFLQPSRQLDSGGDQPGLVLGPQRVHHLQRG